MEIKKIGNSYVLLENETLISEVKWSVAGGGTLLVTKYETKEQDELMYVFIDEVKKQGKTLTPLCENANLFFKRHSDYGFILKQLDEDYLRNRLQEVD